MNGGSLYSRSEFDTYKWSSSTQNICTEFLASRAPEVKNFVEKENLDVEKVYSLNMISIKYSDLIKQLSNNKQQERSQINQLKQWVVGK